MKLDELAARRVYEFAFMMLIDRSGWVICTPTRTTASGRRLVGSAADGRWLRRRVSGDVLARPAL